MRRLYTKKTMSYATYVFLFTKCCVFLSPFLSSWYIAHRTYFNLDDFDRPYNALFFTRDCDEFCLAS